MAKRTIRKDNKTSKCNSANTSPKKPYSIKVSKESSKIGFDFEKYMIEELKESFPTIEKIPEDPNKQTCDFIVKTKSTLETILEHLSRITENQISINFPRKKNENYEAKNFILLIEAKQSFNAITNGRELFEQSVAYRNNYIKKQSKSQIIHIIIYNSTDARRKEKESLIEDNYETLIQDNKNDYFLMLFFNTHTALLTQFKDVKKLKKKVKNLKNNVKNLNEEIEKLNEKNEKLRRFKMRQNDKNKKQDEENKKNKEKFAKLFLLLKEPNLDSEVKSSEENSSEENSDIVLTNSINHKTNLVKSESMSYLRNKHKI